MSTLFIFVFLGAFAGGLVNGLSGFGTGLTALPFWLIVLPPQLASPLAVVCSVVSQAGTLPKVWRIIDFKKVKPSFDRTLRAVGRRFFIFFLMNFSPLCRDPGKFDK